MNKINFDKIYNHVGKVFCAIAGGIIAFTTGSIYWIVPGIAAGALAGHLLERRIYPSKKFQSIFRFF